LSAPRNEKAEAAGEISNILFCTQMNENECGTDLKSQLQSFNAAAAAALSFHLKSRRLKESRSVRLEWADCRDYISCMRQSFLHAHSPRRNWRQKHFKPIRPAQRLN
jgi:hypothetical protein